MSQVPSPPGSDADRDTDTTVDPAEVTELLRGVMDPELGDNIVDLGMVRDVTVGDGGTVTVTVALTTAGCPLRSVISRDVTERIRSLPGVTDVELRWDELTPTERSRVMERARLAARRRSPATAVPLSARVLAVASGKGGVGKSSVTVNLAVALARRGLTVGVLDADIWGFSVPRMLGVEGRLRAERRDDGDRPMIVPHRVPVGDGLIEVVSTGFLVDEDTALMWRGLMLAKALEQFLTDVAWGPLDHLLIDMPPGTGDVQMALARLLPQAAMVVVTTPALAAQKVAARVADMARRSHVPVVGVIENMSGFTCGHGTRYELFGSGGGERLAAELGVPLLGSIPIEPAVADGNDTGRPVALGTGPAADAFGALADRLAAVAVPAADMVGCTARAAGTGPSVQAVAAPRVRR